MEEKEDNNLSIDELEDSELREKLALIDQLAIENKKDKDVDGLEDNLEDDYDDDDDDEIDEDEEINEEDISEDSLEGSDF